MVAWFPVAQRPSCRGLGTVGLPFYPSTLQEKRRARPFLALPSAIIQLLALFVCKLCIVLNANILISKGPATDELKGPESLVLGPCCMRRGRWIEKALTCTTGAQGTGTLPNLRLGGPAGILGQLKLSCFCPKAAIALFDCI